MLDIQHFTSEYAYLVIFRRLESLCRLSMFEFCRRLRVFDYDKVSSWRLRPEAEKIAAPVPQHMAVNLIALKVHEGGVFAFCADFDVGSCG
jgi:hypothetical protein